MQLLLLPLLLAAPALAEKVIRGAPVHGELPADLEDNNKRRQYPVPEVPGVAAFAPGPAYWDSDDVNGAVGTGCLDGEHAKCILSQYNKLWLGDLDELPYLIHPNIQAWYNGTGDEAAGAPAASGQSAYGQYVIETVDNPMNIIEGVSYTTEFFFFGCTTIAQRWKFVGITTGQGGYPKGQLVTQLGIDLIRVIQFEYEGVLYWMILETVTSEDDANVYSQLEEILARATAMGSGGAKKSRRGIKRTETGGKAVRDISEMPVGARKRLQKMAKAGRGLRFIAE